MEKLSIKKEMSIIRLFLSGHSYQEIATKTGVSKGTVANVIAALKAGQFPEAQLPAEQIELLHELATDLHHLKQTPAQAIVGAGVLSHLNELGVEPAEIQAWATMCKDLTKDQAEAQDFVRAAFYLDKLSKNTGLTPQELESKVHALEEKVAHLEPKLQELQVCQKKLEGLEKQRTALEQETSKLQKEHGLLSNQVGQKEQRDSELSHRIQEFEQRLQVADERLALARKELKLLSKLGLSIDDLMGLEQRIGAISQRHGIKPAALRDRLLHELEQLDKGFGLESLVKEKRKELESIQNAVSKASEKRSALESVLQELSQQKASLEAAVAENQMHVLQSVQALNTSVQEAAAKLKQDLQKGTGEALLEVQNIKSQALEVGQELGHFSGVIEANAWLRTMAALIKGDTTASPAEVRAVVLAVVLGLRSYVQHKGTPSYPLTTHLNNVIQELEQWRV